MQACVVSFGSAIRASYVVGAMFYAVIGSWIYSANNLAGMFEKLVNRPPVPAGDPSLSSPGADADGMWVDCVMLDV